MNKSPLLGSPGRAADPREGMGVHVERAPGLHPDLPIQPGHWPAGGGPRPSAHPEQGRPKQ